MNRFDPEQSDRGQLVLVASLALALALVSLGFAYLQLGYNDDISATGHEPAQQLESALDQTLHDAAADVPGTYDWDDRDEAVETVRAELTDASETLEIIRLDDGHAYTLTVNETRAEAWTEDNCPGDANRQFNECTAIDGVVVQERHDAPHVLAASFDFEITTPDGDTSVTTTLEIQAT